MSDNKNFDDEYQYIEEGGSEPTSFEEEPVAGEDEYSDKINSIIQKPNVRRNAIIVIASLFILIGLIKCTTSPTFKRKETELENLDPQRSMPAQTPQAQFQQQPTNVQPAAPTQVQTPAMNMPPPNPVVTNNNLSNADIEQMQNSQRNLQSSLANLNEQVTQLTTQMATLTSENHALEQQLTELQTKESTLISSIERLIAAQKTHHYRERDYSRPTYRVENIPLRYRVHFYVQAIIPGRAWLINSEGHTYTVRVGSTVPGYGVVEKIDPWQGRVVMSSGKILRFNQDL